MFVQSYSILKCDLRVQIGKFTKMHGGDHYIFRHFCFFLQLYLSHSNTKYVKQQVISCSTTLVHHSHIEKCDLEVEKLNRLNSWRPFWKMASLAVTTQISANKVFVFSVPKSSRKRCLPTFPQKRLIHLHFLKLDQCI